ncbi:L,D-transpeptidase family protein [Streptomyces sp. 8N616]|uniref:L,D-transpeptidase family protein n=1 Tax=Streptomyces sp. 8N616 TaxID=3457414 RepID=UPI003FD63A3F
MRKKTTMGRAVAASAVLALSAGSAAGCKAVATQPGAGNGSARTAQASAPEPAPRTDAAEHADAKPAKPQGPAQTLIMVSGARGMMVRELQARLRELALFDRNPTGYYGSITTAAVTSFQARHGLARTGSVDTGTWARLRALTGQPSQWALHPPTSKPLGRPDPRCLTGRALCINKSSSTLAWMIDGRVVSAMDVRFGSQYTPTREGTFSVYYKSRSHFSTIYKTPMPYALFFSGGQAVHYSADFAARGYSGASHGCVNVRDKAKIASLFAQTRIGDKVVIYR